MAALNVHQFKNGTLCRLKNGTADATSRPSAAPENVRPPGGGQA